MFSKIKCVNQEEEESEILNLDALVSGVGQQLPTECPGRQSWKEAVLWAAHAWKTLYLALTMRKSSGFQLEHPITAAPAESFVRKLALLYLKEEAIPWLKFHTTYLFAKHLKQGDLPPRPTFLSDDEISGILAGGWVYNRCHQLMTGDKRHLGAALDILYSKYGMPKASESFVKKTLEEHRKALTTSVPVPTVEVPVLGVPATLTIKPVQICKAIKQLVKSVFRRKYEPRVTVPTRSACFERGCSTGGQLGYLVSEFWNSVYAPCSYEMLGLLDHKELEDMREVSPGCVVTGYSSCLSRRLVEAFNVFLRETVRSRRGEPIKARSFGILEPLKCRVILKGQAAEMCFVTSVQKFMHSSLRECPIFSFIGRPDTVEEIQETFPSLSEGEEFVSGDYSAATDNLNSYFSEYTWDAICNQCDIPSLEREIGKKCLTKHKLYMSKQIRTKEDDGKDQENGQSMGSPMSFPILCLINAAVFGLAYNYSGENLLSAPLRVNGDDIVFKGQKGRYETWWKLNKAVGFYPSKGKNYRADDFLNINSHSYSFDGSNWRRIPVVNQALLQNMCRKGPNAGMRSKTPWFQQKSNFDDLTRGFSPRVCRRLRSVFLQHVDLPKGMPCDLPTRCGGPGFILDTISEDATLLTAIYLCDEKRGEKVCAAPSPKDRSEIGELLQDWKQRHSHVRVTKNPDKERSHVEQGCMVASEILGVCLLSSGAENKVAVAGPNLLETKDDGPFDSPEFRRRRERHELLLKRFYSDTRVISAFRHTMARCLGDKLSPASYDTCMRMNQPWQVNTVYYGQNSQKLPLWEANFWSDVSS